MRTVVQSSPFGDPEQERVSHDPVSRVSQTAGSVPRETDVVAGPRPEYARARSCSRHLWPEHSVS